MFATLNLLPAVKTEEINVYGPPVRGAGWYGPTTGLHTVSLKVSNFRGRISVQASIATKPTDTDWFSVLPSGVAYIQYPRPTFIVTSPSTGETSTWGFSFTSNVVWVRAFAIRDYIIPDLATKMFTGTFGLVESALLKYGNPLGIDEYRRSWEVAPDPQYPWPSYNES